MRLYADEDVEEWAVEILRDNGVNVISAKDTANLGKDDAFHAGFAKRKGRVILTHNAKDYMDNGKLPFQATKGVIALDVGKRTRESYLHAIWMIITFLVPWADIYEDMKIRVTGGGIAWSFVDWRGQLVTDYLSLDDLLAGRYPENDEDE